MTLHPLAERLAARLEKRPSLVVPIEEIVRDGSVKGEFRMRALTVAEECEATEAAVAFRKRVLTALPEKHAQTFLDDASFLEDAKYTERLWRACRLVDDVTRPAFPDSDWMRKHFTTDEMVRVAEWFGRAERLNSKQPDLLTREQRMSLVDACAMAANTNLPDRALSGLPRHVLADLFVWASTEIKARRSEEPEPPEAA